MKTVYILICFIFFIGCQTQPKQTHKIFIKKIDSKLNHIVTKTNTKQNIEPKEKQVEKKIVNNDIAIVYSSNIIGKYALEATNSAIGYLLSSKNKFNLSVYDIKDETKDSIYQILLKLEKLGIKNIVFLVTSDNCKYLNSYNYIDKFNIYLPLVNKDNINFVNKNIVFGGINYAKQFNAIINQATSNIIEIYDDSSLGKSLHNELYSLDLNKTIKSIKLKGKNPHYARILKSHKELYNSSIILNLPIIKSSIILSQLRANDILPSQLFSTQVNYSPLLFVLTQKEDRDNLTIVNSVSSVSKQIEAYNILLDNDILYNWVNFSTILGMEYLLNKDNNVVFKNIKIKDNQVNFNQEFIDVSNFNFKKERK